MKKIAALLITTISILSYSKMSGEIKYYTGFERKFTKLSELENRPMPFASSFEFKMKDYVKGYDVGGKFSVSNFVPISDFYMVEGFGTDIDLYGVYYTPQYKGVSGFLDFGFKNYIRRTNTFPYFETKLKADLMSGLEYEKNGYYLSYVFNTKFDALRAVFPIKAFDIYDYGVFIEYDRAIFGPKAKDVTTKHNFIFEKDKTKANLQFTHLLKKDSLDNINFNFETRYDKIKKLDLGFKANMIYSHKLNYEMKTLNESRKNVGKELRAFYEKYDFNVKYTPYNNLTIDNTLFVNHLHPIKFNDSEPFFILKDYLEYGLDTKISYNGVKNLSLSLDSLIYLSHQSELIQAGDDLSDPNPKIKRINFFWGGFREVKVYRKLYEKTKSDKLNVKLKFGAKYDAMLDKKAIITPEMNVLIDIYNITKDTKRIIKKGTIEGKVNFKYKFNRKTEINSFVSTNIPIAIKTDDNGNKNKLSAGNITVNAGINLSYKY